MKKTIGLSALAIALIGGNAAADIMGSRTLELNFRDVAISTQAQWSNKEKLNVTKAGLGFEGDPAGLWYVSIESSQPFAIGYSWRPAQSAQIDVEVLPPVRPISLSNGETSTPDSGSFYVRYSPDASHWSTWQMIEAQRPTGQKVVQRKFRGQIGVPQREQEVYHNYLHEYSKQDVAWTSDEEAAVQWILKKDPLFFTKHLPFIGYVQVLYETEMNGGRRLERIKVGISYAVSGLATFPKDKKVQEGRDGPWRFRRK